MKISKINCILLILLIILVSLTFKYALTIRDPNILSGYDVGTFRQTIHIIEHHHIFTSRQEAYTYFSNIGNAPGYYPRDLLFSITALVTGKYNDYTDLVEISRFLPIQTVLLIPLASLILFSLFLKIYKSKRGETINQYLGMTGIWLFAALGITYLSSTYGLFFRNALYSWFFVLLVIYVLVKKIHMIKNSIVINILLILFVLLVISYKFTVGLMFLVMLAVVTLLSIIFKNREIYKNFMQLWLVGILIFLFRNIYFTPNRFQGLIRQFSNFFQGKFYQSPQNILSVYRSSSQNYLHVIELALPLLFVFFLLIYYTKKRDNYNRIIFYSFFSLPILAIGFFLWLGHNVVYFRTSQAYAIVSILTVGYVLARACVEKPRLVKYLTLAIIIAALTSSYLVTNVETSEFDYSESKGIIWAGNKINNQDAVFSDFRIGTPLVFYHFTRIHGINRINYPKDLDVIYDKIYQNISDSNLDYVWDKIEQKKRSRPRYIIFSEEMSNKVEGADMAFRAAKEGFMEEYDSLGINKIYSNNEINIYRV